MSNFTNHILSALSHFSATITPARCHQVLITYIQWAITVTQKYLILNHHQLCLNLRNQENEQYYPSCVANTLTQAICDTMNSQISSDFTLFSLYLRINYARPYQYKGSTTTTRYQFHNRLSETNIINQTILRGSGVLYSIYYCDKALYTWNE